MACVRMFRRSASVACAAGGWRNGPGPTAGAGAAAPLQPASSPPVDRALATVRRIAALKPIAGADRVCLAVVDGWQVVVAIADGFKVGDHVVYFEIDSFLPETPRFEFLRKSSFSTHPVLGAGFRLKTAKIRGQLSQGLLLPLSAVLPAEGHGGTAKRPLGADLTAELGVRKWESVVTAAVDVAVGDWPPFLKKTDQPRVQNIAATLWDVSDGEDSHPSLADEAFEVTLKLDGSSCSVYHNKGETGVCSRNLLVWKGEGASDCRDGSGTKGAEPQLEAASTGRYALVGKPIAERLAALGRNLAIQGELMGPAIQGNREKLLKPTFFAFDIWDIDAQRHLPAPERRKLCSQLGIEHARVLHEALPLRKAYPSLEALLAYADSLPSMSHPIAEGIVAKSITRPDFSFKAISNRYLLKCEA